MITTEKPREYLSEEGNMEFELSNYKRQKNFINWQYARIKPYLSGDILETGSGYGTFSEKLVRDFQGKIYLSEIDRKFISMLEEQLGSNERVVVTYLDLNDKEDFSKIKIKFDSILCSHVLEHIKDDVLALEMLKELLRPGGKLVLVVPCHKFLFSVMDIAEGHYRRYSKKELKEKARRAGFKISKVFWFNMFAIPARYVNGNLIKKKTTHQGSFDLFNKLVPVFSFLEEKLFKNITGVNLIMILEA